MHVYSIGLDLHMYFITMTNLKAERESMPNINKFTQHLNSVGTTNKPNFHSVDTTNLPNLRSVGTTNLFTIN